MISLNLTPPQVADLIKTKLHLITYEAPEAQLMYAVWSQALVDAYRAPPITSGRCELVEALVQSKRRTIEDAREFVRSGPACLEFAGIEPAYAERVIRAVEACLPAERRIFQ